MPPAPNQQRETFSFSASDFERGESIDAPPLPGHGHAQPAPDKGCYDAGICDPTKFNGTGVNKENALRHAAQIFVAVLTCCVLCYFPWSYELLDENVHWVAITATLVIEPTQGAVLSKSLKRCLGTVVGGYFGLAVLWLVAKAPSDVLQVAIFFTLLPSGCAASAFLRHRYPVSLNYCFVVFNLTANLIAIKGYQDTVDPETPFATNTSYCNFRVLNICVGIMVGSACSFFVFPNRAALQVHTKAHIALASLGALTAGVLGLYLRTWEDLCASGGKPGRKSLREAAEGNGLGDASSWPATSLSTRFKEVDGLRTSTLKLLTDAKANLSAAEFEAHLGPSCLSCGGFSGGFKVRYTKLIEVELELHAAIHSLCQSMKAGFVSGWIGVALNTELLRVGASLKNTAALLASKLAAQDPALCGACAPARVEYGAEAEHAKAALCKGPGSLLATVLGFLHDTDRTVAGLVGDAGASGHDMAEATLFHIQQAVGAVTRNMLLLACWVSLPPDAAVFKQTIPTFSPQWATYQAELVMAFNADRAPGDRANSDQSWGVDSDIFRKPTVSPLALASLCRGGQHADFAWKKHLVAIGLKTPKDRYSLGASLVSGLEKNDQLAVETAG